jgi:hypothetical protein
MAASIFRTAGKEEPAAGPKTPAIALMHEN